MATDEIAGFDCSFTKPAGADAAAAGFRFAFGYLSLDPSKNLTADQLTDYVSHGIAVGLFWETTARRAGAGAAAGAADGAHADAAADAIGYPADAAIFPAVDWDASPAEYPAIRAYFQAFDAATRRPVGIYAGHDVLEALVTPGQRPIRYGFQAAGWAHGAGLSGKAHFLQRVGHVNWPATIGSAGPAAFDEDVLTIPGVPLMAAASQPAPPAPAPAPVPVVPPGPIVPPASDVPHSGHDATGTGEDFRAHLGDEGPQIAQLERGLNADFPAYSHLPVDGFYGHDDAAVIAEFDHREAIDPATPEADRAGLAASDGEDFGPRSAHAAARYSGLL